MVCCLWLGKRDTEPNAHCSGVLEGLVSSCRRWWGVDTDGESGVQKVTRVMLWHPALGGGGLASSGDRVHHVGEWVGVAINAGPTASPLHLATELRGLARGDGGSKWAWCWAYWGQGAFK